jgi:hypothetical protein
MSRTPSYRRYRSLLAASAAVSIAVGLFACGNGTFQNELPIYDGDVGEIDSGSVSPGDSATVTDAADAASSKLDASDGAAPHEGGGGEGGPHDGGDASTDGHADVE